MLQTSYRTNATNSEGWQEALAAVRDATEYIINLSSRYLAAIEMLEGAGIKARLDEEIVERDGMDVVTSLSDLATKIEYSLYPGNSLDSM